MGTFCQKLAIDKGLHCFKGKESHLLVEFLVKFWMLKLFNKLRKLSMQLNQYVILQSSGSEFQCCHYLGVR